MAAELRLVSANPHTPVGRRFDGAGLHRLADRLTQEVAAGNAVLARRIVAGEELSPIGLAAVAGWMWQAGLDEAAIIEVVAGATAPHARSAHCSARDATLAI